MYVYARVFACVSTALYPEVFNRDHIWLLACSWKIYNAIDYQLIFCLYLCDK